MATLQAFLSTTTGLVVALAALLGAVGGLFTAVLKFSSTRARLTKLEAEVKAVAEKLGSLERTLQRVQRAIRTHTEVESVRSSLIPEHADAEDLEELRAEVATLRHAFEEELRSLVKGFTTIETTLRLLLDGKVKLQ